MADPLDAQRWRTLQSAMRLRLGGQAFRLLVVMLRTAQRVPQSTHQQRGLLSWPSTAEIRAESGLSSSSVHFARQELIAAGILSRDPGHRQNGCEPVAIYQINPIPKVTAEARSAAKARRRRQRSRTEQKRQSEARREIVFQRAQ
jgi:hypothetical protein